MSEKAPWDRERKLLEKMEEDTDPSYGRPPDKRSLAEHFRFGIVNLDKPSGPSSHEVVAWVKRMLGLKHAGHGGTLEARETAGDIQWSPVFFRSHWKMRRGRSRSFS